MEEVNKTTVTKQDPFGNTASQTVTTRTSNFMGDFFVSKTNQVMFSIISIIDLLILIRFTLLMFGANRVDLVNFILNLTEVFVAPFRGIFPSQSIEGSYFEAASIVAIIMWTILGFIIATIINMFSTSTESPV